MASNPLISDNWEPSEEMQKTLDLALDPLGFGDCDCRAALKAVRDLIIAEARPQIEAAERERIAIFTPTHRHWKGGLYQKIYDAAFEGTMEPAVVYRGADGSVWIRSTSNFDEQFAALKDSKP